MNTLVSVLIPYYNDEEFLYASIESVLNQTYKNFELILLNHASNDKSREIARSFNDERIIHIDMEMNYGAGGGILLEKFVQTAKGRYLKIFCADDIMLPNCIETLVNYLENNPEKDFVFANMDYVDKNGKKIKKNWCDEHKHYNFEDKEIDIIKKFILGLSFLPLPTVLIKSEILKNIEFDKSTVMVFDIWVWFLLLTKGYKIGLIDKKIVHYRVHDNQVSSFNKLAKIQRISSYECFILDRILFEIDDYDLIKSICKDNPYLEKITKDDKNYFKFILATQFIKHKRSVSATNAYCIIHDYLNDESMRNKLKEKFNFTVKDFREMYSTAKPAKSTCVKDFGILMLIFYIFRRIWKTITLQRFFKFKKRYTA